MSLSKVGVPLATDSTVSCHYLFLLSAGKTYPLRPEKRTNGICAVHAQPLNYNKAHYGGNSVSLVLHNYLWTCVIVWVCPSVYVSVALHAFFLIVEDIWILSHTRDIACESACLINLNVADYSELKAAW